MLILPRLVAVLVSLIATACALQPAPADAAPRASSVSLAVSQRSVQAGDRVVLRAASPRGRFAKGDVVRFQQRRGTTWSTIRTATLPSSGRAEHVVRLPARTHAFRIVKDRSRRYAASTSGTVKVAVQQGASALKITAEPRVVARGDQTRLRVVSDVGQLVADAPVLWQRRIGEGSWEDVRRTRLDDYGAAVLDVRPDGPETTYRATQAETTSFEESTSPELTVRVVARPTVVAWADESHVAVGGTLEVRGEKDLFGDRDTVMLQRLEDGVWQDVMWQGVLQDGTFHFNVHPPEGRFEYRVWADPTEDLARVTSAPFVLTASDRKVPGAVQGRQSMVLNGAPIALAYTSDRSSVAVVEAPADTGVQLHDTGDRPFRHGADGFLVRDPSGRAVPTNGHLGFRTGDAGRYTISTDASGGSGTWDLSATTAATYSAVLDGPAVRISTGSARGRALQVSFEGKADDYVWPSATNTAGWLRCCSTETTGPPMSLVEVSTGRVVPKASGSDVWRLPSSGRYRLQVTPWDVRSETSADLALVSARAQPLELNAPTTRVASQRRGGLAVYEVELPSAPRVTVATTSFDIGPSAFPVSLSLEAPDDGVRLARLRTSTDQLTRYESPHHPAGTRLVVARFDPRSRGAFDLDVTTPRVVPVGSGSSITASTEGLAGRETIMQFDAVVDEYVEPGSAPCRCFTAVTSTLGYDDPGLEDSYPTRVRRSDDVYQLVLSPGEPVQYDGPLRLTRARPEQTALNRNRRLNFAPDQPYRVMRYQAALGTRLMVRGQLVDPHRRATDLEVRGAIGETMQESNVRRAVASQGPVDVIVRTFEGSPVDIAVTDPDVRDVRPGAPPTRLSTAGLPGREMAVSFDARAGDIVTWRVSNPSAWALRSMDIRSSDDGGYDRDGLDYLRPVGGQAKEFDGLYDRTEVWEVLRDGKYLIRFEPRTTTEMAADVSVAVSTPQVLDVRSGRPSSVRSAVTTPGGIAAYHLVRSRGLLRIDASRGTFRTGAAEAADVLVSVTLPRSHSGSGLSLRHRRDPVSGYAEVESTGSGAVDAPLVIIVDPADDATGTVDLVLTADDQRR